MGKLVICTLAALGLMVMATGRQAMGAEPRVVAVQLFTQTDFDGKDQDTGLYVDVWTGDGTVKIAECRDADKIDYDAHTDHTISLNVLAPRVAAGDCYGFRCRLTQYMHGHDTWVCSGRVTLYFSDGKRMVAEFPRTELKNSGASVTFSNHGDVIDGSN